MAGARGWGVYDFAALGAAKYAPRLFKPKRALAAYSYPLSPAARESGPVTEPVETTKIVLVGLNGFDPNGTYLQARHLRKSADSIPSTAPKRLKTMDDGLCRRNPVPAVVRMTSR